MQVMTCESGEEASRIAVDCLYPSQLHKYNFTSVSIILAMVAINRVKYTHGEKLYYACVFLQT
jgi:hypothetical protein